MNSTAGSATTPEPVFEATEIQGNVVPGFNKPHQCLVGLRIGAVDIAKAWLRTLADQLSSMQTVLADRQAFRKRRREAPADTQKVALAEAHDQLHMNVSFSYEGLRKLSADTQSFESDAFRLGLPTRSSLLGDPTDPKNPGSPENWTVGGPGKVPDVLVVIAADRADAITTRLATLLAAATAAGLTVIYEERGDVLPGDLQGHEHFGFHDNVSQPGVRGMVADVEGLAYVERRTVASSEVPDALLNAYPGQDLVWPGQFVLGYPVQTPDPLVPGAPSQPQPGWAKNGAFLVFRRLRQDVRLFWDVMAKEADRLAKLPGFGGMTQMKLAALIVGRWPSGAPVSRTPAADDPELGNDPYANNHFHFDADTCPVALAGGRKDTYPNAKADPLGITCPLTSHIRKVNTRDSANDDGGTVGTYVRRILRRGLPFGKPLVKSIDGSQVELETPDPEEGDRGLLFLGVVASIEDQFEFLRNRWMSNRFAPKSPGGDDVFIGLNGNAGQDRVRKGVLFGSGLQTAEVATNAEWIIPTGGGYFFTPSISAVRDVLGT